MSDNTIDPKFFNQVSQIAHISTMYAINFTAGVFDLKALWVTVPVSVAYATWHEFIYDPKHENAVTRGSDLEDFICLSIGIALGAVMAVISHI